MVRDEAGLLAFLDKNTEHGKREVMSIAYRDFDFRIAEVDAFINEQIEAGRLRTFLSPTGQRGRPRVIVTGA